MILLMLKQNDVKGEIASITNLATDTVLNAKINEVKSKIPNITYLATIAAFPTMENKILNVSNFVEKVTITQRLVMLKMKLLLIMIIINILLVRNILS